MPMQESERRKALVRAAEEVMDEAFVMRATDEDRWKAEKSQFNQLIGVCGEALCAEEIENYLRYQASRERPSWGLKLALRTIEKFRASMDASADDRTRVEAWRYFAVYLARSFTYHKQVSRDAAPQGRRPR